MGRVRLDLAKGVTVEGKFEGPKYTQRVKRECTRLMVET
jgi:hypothetical protein